MTKRDVCHVLGRVTTSSTQARTAALRAAVSRAILAPSIHNTQPWRFVLGPARLTMLADRSRQLAVLDPTGRQLHLSCGCALFNARVSLAAAGLGVIVTRQPKPARPDLLAVIEIVDDRRPDARPAELDGAIEQRQTNRRRFTDSTVPDDLTESLVSAATAEGAVLHTVTRADTRMTVARLTQQADAQQNANPAYRAELRAWTTTDPERRDGVTALAVPHVTGESGSDVPIRDFDSEGVGFLPADTQSSGEQCLLLLGTHDENPRAWLRAGEALERLWLEITRAGYVASLFTQIVEIDAIRAQLRSELRLVIHPHVLLRVGRAPATPATRRRPIAEVLDDRAVTLLAENG